MVPLWVSINFGVSIIYPQIGILSHSAKKRTLRQWDAEWGRIGREGNIWWMGSKRQNWEAVMGRNIWWWFRQCRPPERAQVSKG